MVFTNFLIFFAVPLSIKTVMPKGTGVQVSLMIAFIVYTLEGMRAWFILFSFEMWRIGLLDDICQGFQHCIKGIISNFTVSTANVNLISVDILNVLNKVINEYNIEDEETN